MTLKNISRVLIYVSIIFMVIYLFRTNKFEQISINHVGRFVLSLFVLFSAFMLNPLRWWMINRYSNIPITFRLAVKSTGLSIMGKYIPGKLWLAIGKAAIVSKETKYPLETLLNNSFYFQLLGVGTGLLFGLPFLAMFSSYWLIISYVVLLMGFFWVAFNDIPYKLIPAVFKRWTSKLTSINKLRPIQVLKLLIVFLLEWSLVGLAFVLMAHSIEAHSLIYSTKTVSIFPFSSVLGILAFITPGGLGVREGVIAYLLNSLDAENIALVSLAALSRLWFLTCEIVLFLIGLVLSLKKQQVSNW